MKHVAGRFFFLLAVASHSPADDSPTGEFLTAVDKVRTLAYEGAGFPVPQNETSILNALPFVGYITLNKRLECEPILAVINSSNCAPKLYWYVEALDRYGRDEECGKLLLDKREKLLGSWKVLGLNEVAALKRIDKFLSERGMLPVDCQPSPGLDSVFPSIFTAATLLRQTFKEDFEQLSLKAKSLKESPPEVKSLNEEWKVKKTLFRERFLEWNASGTVHYLDSFPGMKSAFQCLNEYCEFCIKELDSLELIGQQASAIK